MLLSGDNRSMLHTATSKADIVGRRIMHRISFTSTERPAGPADAGGEPPPEVLRATIAALQAERAGERATAAAAGAKL